MKRDKYNPYLNIQLAYLMGLTLLFVCNKQGRKQCSDKHVKFNLHLTWDTSMKLGRAVEISPRVLMVQFTSWERMSQAASADSMQLSTWFTSSDSPSRFEKKKKNTGKRGMERWRCKNHCSLDVLSLLMQWQLMRHDWFYSRWFGLKRTHIVFKTAVFWKSSRRGGQRRWKKRRKQGRLSLSFFFTLKLTYCRCWACFLMICWMRSGWVERR